jgi:hypothetical protein
MWEWEGGKKDACTSLEKRAYKGGYANEMQEGGYNMSSRLHHWPKRNLWHLRFIHPVLIQGCLQTQLYLA